MKSPQNVFLNTNQNTNRIVRVFCLGVLLFIPEVYAYSQQTKKVNKFEERSIMELRVKRPTVIDKMPLPFKELEIIDARADTSSVGFFKNAYDKVVTLNYPGGVANEFKSYLQANYSFSTSDTSAPVLLIVLKRFRATTFCDTSLEESLEHQWAPALMLKMEVYAGFPNGYKPLKRIEFDHPVKNITGKILEQQSDTVFDEAITDFTTSIKKPLTATGLLSFRQIKDYNRKNYDLPILRDTELRRGVYLTLEEFKRNQPSYTNFTVEEGRLGDMISITDTDGKEYPVREVWGYCDGKLPHIKLADNYYTLYSAHNAFNLMGAKEVTSKKRIKAGAILAFGLMAPTSKDNMKTVFNLVLKPLQLDPASGEVW